MAAVCARVLDLGGCASSNAGAVGEATASVVSCRVADLWWLVAGLRNVGICARELRRPAAGELRPGYADDLLTSLLGECWGIGLLDPPKMGAPEPWEKMDGEPGPMLDLQLSWCETGRSDSRRIHEPLDVDVESLESSAIWAADGPSSPSRGRQVKFVGDATGGAWEERWGIGGWLMASSSSSGNEASRGVAGMPWADACVAGRAECRPIRVASGSIVVLRRVEIRRDGDGLWPSEVR